MERLEVARRERETRENRRRELEREAARIVEVTGVVNMPLSRRRIVEGRNADGHAVRKVYGNCDDAERRLADDFRSRRGTGSDLGQAGGGDGGEPERRQEQREERVEERRRSRRTDIGEIESDPEWCDEGDDEGD
jgi:hypothetical protein